jgi:hypothetical protein
MRCFIGRGGNFYMFQGNKHTGFAVAVHNDNIRRTRQGGTDEEGI